MRCEHPAETEPVADDRLWLTDRTIETHVGSILAKLGLPNSDDHRRVLAVVLYLSRHRAREHTFSTLDAFTWRRRTWRCRVVLTAWWPPRRRRSAGRGRDRDATVAR